MILSEIVTSELCSCQIEAHERNLQVDSESRSARSEVEMAREAAMLRELFQKHAADIKNPLRTFQ